VRKPLIITCSTDKSVRVWNYVDSTSDIVKVFLEEAHSVSLHPTGLYALVGFSDKLKLLNVLMDDIRPYKEFNVRSCREARFSNGGQYFAALHGNVIQIYDTWTFENIGNLKGHNGKIKSIQWTPMDNKIISCGADGAVYEWSLKEFKREKDCIVKNTGFFSAVPTIDGNTIYASAGDKTFREMVDGQIVREIELDTVFTQMVLSYSGRMLLAATGTGTIRAIRYPLPIGTELTTLEYTEHFAHEGSISRLRVSFDDQYLFSAGEDGLLAVFKLTEEEDRTVKRTGNFVFADEVNSVLIDIQTNANGIH